MFADASAALSRLSVFDFSVSCCAARFSLTMRSISG